MPSLDPAVAATFLAAWRAHGNVRRAMREAGIGSTATAHRLIALDREASSSPDPEPTRIDPDLALEVIRIRRAHPDWDARTISRRLCALHRHPVCEPSAVHSILRAAGLSQSPPPPLHPTTGTRYPRGLRDRARRALAAGAAVSDIAFTYGIHRDTINRWCLPSRSRSGRAARIPPRDWPALRSQVHSHPDATLREHCDLWRRSHGVAISEPTMSSTLAHLDLVLTTGRPRRIPPSMWPALRAQVDAHPDATLREHCRLWQGAHGVTVSEATMSRLFHRLGLTPPGRAAIPADDDPPPS